MMKKFLLTAIVSIIPLSAFAEGSRVDEILESLAFYDAKHERIACDSESGIILCVDENENPYSGTAYAESRTEEPAIKADLKVKDGKISGPVKIYENDVPALETFYINGIQEGIETNYYPNGKTSMIIGYLNGKRHGTSQEYDERGTLVSIANWKYDKQDGEMKEFYPNGNLKSVSSWKDDVQHGISAFYGEDGRITEKALWSHGKVVKYYSR